MRSVSSLRAVSMMIGTVEPPRIDRVTSYPSMPGRPRSSTTRSGRDDRKLLAGRPGAGHGHLEPGLGEIVPHQVGDLELVIDDEDPGA